MARFKAFLKNRSAMVQCLFIALLLFGGCSTVNKELMPPPVSYHPPDSSNWPMSQALKNTTRVKDLNEADQFLTRIETETPRKTTLWWTQYKRAQLWSKKDREKSCGLFKSLAADKDFPLRTIAELRAFEFCDGKEAKGAKEIVSWWAEKWIEEAAMDVAISRAERDKSQADLLELYTRKSKLPLRKEEKIEYTERALKIARALKDKAEIAALEKRLYSLSPSLNPKPDPTDALALAADFRFHRNFAAARKQYLNVIRGKKFSLADKVSAHRGIRASHRLQLNRDQALVASRDLVRFVENHFKKIKRKDMKMIADVNLQLARDLWTEQKIKEAERILEGLLRRLPAGPSLAETFWILGRMAEEKQDFAGAVLQYEKAVAQPGITKDFKERVNWYYAWNLRKQKDFDRAIATFSDLKKETSSSYDQIRYSYWLGATLREKGEADQATKEFEELVSTEPLSYYGYLAHRELDLELPMKTAAREVAQERQLSTRLLRSKLDHLFIEWLIAVNEGEIARPYLDQIAAEFRKSKAADLKDWTALFQYYARAGEYLSLFSQMSYLPLEDRKTLIQKNPELMFPQPYYDVASQASTKFSVSTDFIYAIMRQESSFNPNARSQMDAFGLMQLLPEVAARTAAENSIRYGEADDLYDPVVNIALGAAHLKELLDRYKGEIILATASYNASEKAIHNWLLTRYRPHLASPTLHPTLEFIEDIPYDETRDYVKLVLRNFVTYQMLTARDRAIKFPDWTLALSK